MNASAVVPVRSPASLVPPWALLWSVVWAVSLPGLIGSRIAGWEELGPDGPYDPEVVSSVSFDVLRAAAVLNLIPSLFLLVGLGAVLVPQVRAWIVERSLGLSVDRRPVVQEIEAFLRGYHTNVEVRLNAMRADRLVRVYPASWRRARLAVFGPFLKLWRRDNAAARAVLLHEVAHLRAGDHLVLGLGSPFVALANAWFVLLLALGVAPVVVLVVVGYPTADLLVAQVGLAVMLLPTTLLLPVGALWAAELTADRFVVDAGLEAHLRTALDLTARSSRTWRGLLGHLSHPPPAVRRAAALPGRGVATVLLAGWPLLLLIQLLVTLVAAVVGWWILGWSGADISQGAVTNSHAFLLDSLRIWAPATLVLLAWPLVAPVWTRWWSGTTATSSADCVTPALAAFVVLVVVAALLLLTG